MKAKERKQKGTDRLYQKISFLLNSYIFMREMKKVYQKFQVLRRNGDNTISKAAYSSLDKYSKSPYLQKIMISSNKKTQQRESTPSHLQLDLPNNPNASEAPPKLPKLTTPIKYRDADSYFKTELEPTETLFKGKSASGSHSATLEVSSKTAKLQPIHKNRLINYATRTKAGTNGKQPKINQDIAILQSKLPFGLRLFSVCDGHGVNGHIVSSYIKAHLIKNLIALLKGVKKAPEIEQIKQIMQTALAKTNNSLLESEINTQLSGSTVVVVLIYKQKILCFNVGDSRAILIRQVLLPPETPKEEDEPQFIEFKFHQKHPRHRWSVIPLSDDQKPEREDERKRIENFGGRVFSQKNEKGQNLGPLRVWMKQIDIPGLAMTRSFGDKAGIRSGTTSIPEITQTDITPEDRFIVIASDGIWQYLQNQEVMTLIIPYAHRGDIETAAERLVKMSTQIWQKVSFSRDDITAIIIDLAPNLQK